LSLLYSCYHNVRFRYSGVPNEKIAEEEGYGDPKKRSSPFPITIVPPLENAIKNVVRR